MKLLFLFVLMMVGCQKKPTNFESLYSISSHFDQKTSELSVDISLDKSIHAYADGEKIGIPLRLEVSPKNGWVADGDASIPKGKLKKLSPGESQVLMGNIKVSQKLKNGTGPGEAHLHLQVCSDKACDRPRVHKILFQ